MRNGLKFMGLAAIAALSLTAYAIQNGIVVKRVPKVGDVMKYRLKAEMDFQGQSIAMNALLLEKVTKVEEGQYTSTSEMPEMKINMGGNEMDLSGQTGGPTTTVSKLTGEIVSVATDQADENTYRLAHLNSIRFPETPLKVGDTWTFEIKKDSKGSVNAKGSYKVEAQEKIDGFDTYKISGTVKETEGTAPASADGTYWIDIKDGSLIKMTGTMKNAPYPQIGPIDAKISMTREK